MSDDKSLIADVMTEQEILQAATEEWLRILVRLWEAIGKPVEEDRLQVYRNELGGVPLGLLELAVSRCIRENTWNTVPPIGKVWEAVRKELGNPYEDIQAAMDRWCSIRWEHSIYRFGVAAATEPA